MDAKIADKVDTFFDSYRLRKYAKGQVLILNGDAPEYVYHLLSGRVKQYDVSYRGDEVILNTFQPPAFFPMSLAINQLPNPYTYEAETDVELRQAPAKDVVVFIKENPDVLFDLLTRVYRGTDGMLARMSHLMASSAKGRLMFEILLSCRRYGEENTDGSYTLIMNEKELAARAGLSRETVSREMHKLIEEKLAVLQNGTITIHDMGEFEAKLGKVI
jgi:CRP-like cAMP-binding protein